MKFQGCTSMNSTENIQEGYRDGLSKIEFDKCQQSFTLTMCLPACLRDYIARSPRLITRLQLRSFLQNVMTINFRKIYCIASMFIITRALGTPRDVERRESGSMFCETNHFLKFERIK